MLPRVLLVDDDLDLAVTLSESLRERGYEAEPCASSEVAAKRLETEPIDALVTDLRMPGIDGMGLLARSRAANRERPVIVMTAYGAVETAIEAIRQGAYHYLTKPFAIGELVLFLGRAMDDRRLRGEARALRTTLRAESALGSLIGTSAAMREVFEVVTRVAAVATPVLLVGETGTGKSALARAIHSNSPRVDGPFVAVNCAALPETLLESELFGHVRGAFTGATSARDGLFAEASGGTLLLDEIGEMSAALQAKLLHVLESETVRAVGASKERRIDVRIVAATHRDLRQRVGLGTFREDLFYRLDVVTIEIPPLRHRPEDIPLLAHRMLTRAKEKHPQSPVERFSREAMARLVEHPWPGNVRELAHAIERVVVLARTSEVTPPDLPATVTGPTPIPMPSGSGSGVLPIREIQKRYAVWALERLGGHRRRTAEALEVDSKTLAKWLNGDGES